MKEATTITEAYINYQMAKYNNSQLRDQIVLTRNANNKL
uniref:Uncharacterized protein n=1 Tax=Arundo donax TaxID=35708 RepID=A0A0A9A7Y2_ARUDO